MDEKEVVMIIMRDISKFNDLKWNRAKPDFINNKIELECNNGEVFDIIIKKERTPKDI